MKILITGCYGFIASHTMEVLKRHGIETIGIARHVENSIVIPDTMYLGDMRDKSLVEKAVGYADGVINLAGVLGTQETIKNPYPSVETNIVGALHVLEAVKHFDIPLTQISVGNHWMNNSYSITKSTAERFTLMYVKEHKIKANIVRALNAFGERQKHYPVRKMMPFFINQALNNRDIEVYGDGDQIMDFVYVKDVSNVMLDALKKAKDGDTGNVYEAGTGNRVTVKQWAEKIITLTGSKSKIVHLPMRPGEPEKSEVVANNPYPYEYTDTDKALSNVIEWYKQCHKN